MCDSTFHSAVHFWMAADLPGWTPILVGANFISCESFFFFFFVGHFSAIKENKKLKSKNDAKTKLKKQFFSGGVGKVHKRRHVHKREDGKEAEKLQRIYRMSESEGDKRDVVYERFPSVKSFDSKQRNFLVGRKV